MAVEPIFLFYDETGEEDMMIIWHPDCVVEFRFFRPTARHVQLVGEFNGWDPSATPMSREDTHVSRIG